MQFQIINYQQNQKKKARLKKEVANFIRHLETIAIKSRRLLALLQSLAEKSNQKNFN